MKKFFTLLALVAALTVCKARTIEVTNEQALPLGAGNWLMVTFDVRGEGYFSVWGENNVSDVPVLLRDWAPATEQVQHITVFVREIPFKLFYDDIFVEVRHNLVERQKARASR